MNEAFLHLVFNIALVIPLYLASKEDMKYHRIDKKYVVWILLTVLIYTLLTREYVIDRTFSFLITLGIFSALTVFSKGGFGFGDTLILGALGWYIGSLTYLRYFFILLVIVIIIWGIYQTLSTKKEHGDRKGIRRVFDMSKMIPIDEINPGMILAKDYFMKGLNEKEIVKLKKEGHVYLDIKQAYPFIPVILITFIIYIFASLYF